MSINKSKRAELSNTKPRVPGPVAHEMNEARIHRISEMSTDYPAFVSKYGPLVASSMVLTDAITTWRLSNPKLKREESTMIVWRALGHVRSVIDAHCSLDTADLDGRQKVKPVAQMLTLTPALPGVSGTASLSPHLVCRAR